MKRALLSLLLPALLQAETHITWKRVQLQDQFYSEGANYADINKDGHADIISGPYWYEGPDWQRKHAFYEPKVFNIFGYSDNFFCYAHDFTGNGWLDILVVGFPGKEARLYLNPGRFDEDKPWPMHIVAEVVDGESPVFTDITGDGKPEIVCGNGGRFGWFAPDWSNPTAMWPFVPVTENVQVAKFTHGMGVGDVDGDGKLDLLEAKRWWRQGAGVANSGADLASPAPWQPHTFALGVPGGAQMFAYDFDGDGRNDIFTTLAAHRHGVAVFFNRAGQGGANWERRLIIGEHPWENDYGVVFSQPHAAHLADMDGDGVMDVVTGKRYWAHNGRDAGEHAAKVLYWLQTKRDGKGGVEFIPHLISADCGVGVDVQVGDVNGDGFPDVIVGNKAGVFVLLQERQEVSQEVAEQMRPKKMYGEGLMPYGEYKEGQPAAEALKNLQLPGGFKAELIAAEPDVVQPIAMCWDERGRLWVVEGNSYPKPREVGAGQDRILIFEDSNGDGTFETRKVFAEGLNLVSGIELGFGGVWVGAAPYLMFIPDRDRDDKPDAPDAADPRPKVPGLNFTAYALLDGWGSQDTHETLNSFIWGPDGWLYGCHGVFTHSRVGKPCTPDAQRVPINAGVWRYHPVRHEFEVYAHGTSNPWGLDYDQHGEFFVTACVIPHLYHIVPGGRYHRQAGQHFNPHTYEDIKTIADHAHFAGEVRENAHWGPRREGGLISDDTNMMGGGHAHCGLAIYQSSQFPATYRNQLIFGNLHGHRLVMDELDPKASTYIGKHGSDFLRANDLHFIPVSQRVGPDGSLYVSDWADKQICHRGSNAVEMWDRSNGRIYRVSYTTSSDRSDLSDFPTAPFDLSKETDVKLAQLAVQTENEWFSRMARRVLMERAVYTKELETDHVLRTAAANQTIKSLWLRHVIGVSAYYLDKSDAPTQKDIREIAALKSDSASVRTSAVRLLASMPLLVTEDPTINADGWETRSKAFTGLAQKEASPTVRRELASALQRLPQNQRKALAAALLQRAEDKDDPMIPLLIWYGIEPLVGDDAQAGLELARVSKMPKVTQFIYRRLGAEQAGRTAVLRVAADSEDVEERESLLKSVVEAARAGNKIAKPADWDTLRDRLMATQMTESPRTPEMGPPAKGILVAELEAFMGIEPAIAAFRERLTSTAPLDARVAALKLLVQIRDAQTAAILHTLLGNGQDAHPTLRRAAIQALATLPHPRTPAMLAGLLPALAPVVKNDAINTLATTPEGSKTLLLAVKEEKVAKSLLSPFLARQMDALKNAEVSALLKEVWGDLNAPKPDLEQRKQKFRAMLTPDALAKADLAQGKTIYSAVCGTCHTLFGQGAKVGPDLTGSNRANLDYLLDNVLDPNAVIGKDYQLNIFELADGRLASGIIKEESPAAWKVAMPGGIEQLITKAEVKKRTVSPVSTMPEGLFDALPQEQLLALVAYLQSPGGDAGAGAGMIEAEKLQAKVSNGKTAPQGMGNFRDGRWSGDSHLFWTGGKPGDTLTLSFPVAEAGKRKVYAVLTKAPDYGSVRLTVNGAAASTVEMDLYDAKVTNTEEVLLGEFDFKPGAQKLEITISGANPKARPGRWYVALDYLRVE
ncbi:MAG TPA: cytochrome C [Verrucomicrobiales bacterium]|nr:cytochrome C [Verrucomicrobiales bacterium]